MGNGTDALPADLAAVPGASPGEEAAAGESNAWSEQTSSQPWADSEDIRTDNAVPSSWDNAASDLVEASTESYPESDRRTWRTAEQWFLAAEEAAREEEQAAPAWHDSERSAARLRPEIEHPPLPRDRLR